MQARSRSGSRARVQRVFEIYVTDARLTRNFHKVLASIYEKAGVRLTNVEKAMLLRKIARTFGKDGRGIHPQ